MTRVTSHRSATPAHSAWHWRSTTQRIALSFSWAHCQVNWDRQFFITIHAAHSDRFAINSENGNMRRIFSGKKLPCTFWGYGNRTRRTSKWRSNHTRKHKRTLICDLSLVTGIMQDLCFMFSPSLYWGWSSSKLFTQFWVSVFLSLNVGFSYLSNVYRADCTAFDTLLLHWCKCVLVQMYVHGRYARSTLHIPAQLNKTVYLLHITCVCLCTIFVRSDKNGSGQE